MMYENEPAATESYQPSTKSLGYETEGPSRATGGSLTASELPKSGVVNPIGDGSVDVGAKQQPGYLASAAGKPRLLLFLSNIQLT